jgi:hypothetical protein
MNLRQAIIVDTHPEDHSVDLVMLDDGTRHIGVQVSALGGSARSGVVDLPAVPASDNKWDITQRNGQDMQALVAFIGRNPVVVGMLYPQINQMLLKDPKARRFRHQSDVETLIDGDGNMQLSHPSGTYIRIGEAIEADTLAGKHADESATDRNTGRAVNIHIGMAGGVLDLTMSPSGAVSLRCNQGVNIAAQSVTLDTPTTTLTGKLVVQGDTELQAVTSRGHDISSTHVHTGVLPGGATTGTPP